MMLAEGMKHDQQDKGSVHSSTDDQVEQDQEWHTYTWQLKTGYW